MGRAWANSSKTTIVGLHEYFDRTGFLIEAAWHVNPREARGLGGALRALEQRPFGPWMLGIVAAGLTCYGLYLIVLAWYRRVRG